MSAKYPRTPHLPWSPGASADDKRLSSADHLLDRRIVITLPVLPAVRGRAGREGRSLARRVAHEKGGALMIAAVFLSILGVVLIGFSAWAEHHAS